MIALQPLGLVSILTRRLLACISLRTGECVRTLLPNDKVVILVVKHVS